MTTDNRTPKQTESKSSQDFVFTEAQIEAAAKAVADAMFPRWVEGDRVLRSRDEGSLIRTAARAALVAAAGAAPQAESNPTSSYISPSLPGMIRNLWKSDPSENSVRTALKLAGDLIQELIDLRAANMLLEPGGPDAATGESEKRAWAIASHLERDRELIKAERDAAVAAIERVRARLQPTLGGTPTGEFADVCGCGKDYFPCDHAAAIIAALDGAPEPEEKP